jgi:hypothetical protein
VNEAHPSQFMIGGPSSLLAGVLPKLNSDPAVEVVRAHGPTTGPSLIVIRTSQSRADELRAEHPNLIIEFDSELDPPVST